MICDLSNDKIIAQRKNIKKIISDFVEAKALILDFFSYKKSTTNLENSKRTILSETVILKYKENAFRMVKQKKRTFISMCLEIMTMDSKIRSTRLSCKFWDQETLETPQFMGPHHLRLSKAHLLSFKLQNS